MKKLKTAKLHLQNLYYKHTMKLKYGQFVIVHKGSTECPEGAIAKVLSRDPIGGSYTVTTVLNSHLRPGNPVIIANEDGHKIHKDEFEASLHARVGEVTPIDFKKESELVGWARTIFITAGSLKLAEMTAKLLVPYILGS